MTYAEQITSDIVHYLVTEEVEVTERNMEDVFERLLDELWIEDDVTGNGSGSYYCNRELAKEQVLSDGIQYFMDLSDVGMCGQDIINAMVMGDWEQIDVSIRCLLVSECLWDALEKVKK